ncbi:putative OB-fold protein [Azospirillum agricola]|uniref:Zn-ribbon domain-containing OB-fold protein n=1 Tax=Azospirillum agricola TaxID=1720247 RepID=UPI001AE9E039|nr:OB-fold domain-containing protein [Azospirillum agricola]MBP2227879.1 putative OB-fold protein [Azospirillum agricola]
MPSDPAVAPTSGAAFGEDALPFRDLQAAPSAQFEIVDGAVLLKGSLCRSSGSKAFPARRVCLDTGATDMEPILIGPRGSLYSFSTVHVSSARPTPYSIGYVDFENGVRVLAQVDVPAGATLACDSPVELRAEGDRWFVVPVDGKGLGQ